MKKLTKKFLAFAYNVSALCKGSFAHKHEVGEENKKENFSGGVIIGNKRIYISQSDFAWQERQKLMPKQELELESNNLVFFVPALAASV